MPLTEADIEEEERHFQQVVNAFKNYARFSISVNNRRRRDIYRLTKADQDILDSIGFKKKVEDADKAILANAQFLAQMVDNPEIFGSDIDSDGGAEVDEPSGAKKPPSASDSAGGKRAANSNVIPPSHSHSHSHGHSHEHVPRRGQDHHHTRGATSSQPRSRSTENDMDKLRSTLKQFVRDWSTEGKEERDVCYQPMKDALLKYFSHVPESERGKLRVLVPGAGLGRLAWDVAALGFTCQANEFSHYMLLGSFFILNRTDQIEKHTFYPYVHSFSNIPDRNALLRPIKIPDVLPSDLPRTANFSLVAGDFEEVYGAPVIDPSEPHAGLWDAILTCFFIDTAKNVVNYLRIIHKLLAPGGVWVNLGPLLWHWEHNETNEVSVELDLDELKALVRKMGFEISNERTVDTTYTNNTQSMIGYTYHTAFWTATKVA